MIMLNHHSSSQEKTARAVQRLDLAGEDQDHMNDLLRRHNGKQCRFTDQARAAKFRFRYTGFGDLALSEWAVTSSIKMRPLEGSEPPLSIVSLKEGKVRARFGKGCFEGVAGRTVPCPPRPDVFEVEDKFTDVSVQIKTATIETALAQRLTFAPQEPLQLDRVFFAPELARCWNAIETTLQAFSRLHRCPPLALINLRDHAVGLLLDQHSHNYSRYLLRHETMSRRTVRDAMRWMQERIGDPITVGDVAEAMRCSVKALTHAFQDYERTTPSAYIYSLRLDWVRNILRQDPAARSAADVARESGFIDLVRFDRLYADRHGERADETLQRNLPARPDQTSSTTAKARRPSTSLNGAQVELLREHVDKSLGGTIRLPDLARLVDMNVHNFLVAFRRSFGTTPAQYVLAERLRRARWLLEHTPLSVAAIAAEAGFSSQSHLCTQFKLKEKMPPMRYRTAIR